MMEERTVRHLVRFTYFVGYLRLDNLVMVVGKKSDLGGDGSVVLSNDVLLGSIELAAVFNDSVVSDADVSNVSAVAVAHYTNVGN